MRIFLIAFLVCAGSSLHAQELYVFKEPASNMPANSFAIRLNDHYTAQNKLYTGAGHRFMPQLYFGFSKKLMIHLGATFSNMHTPDFRYESVDVYAKYRFLSHDDVHKHFRMAAYIEAAKTKAPFHYNEINLMGDKSGIGAGLVVTQLWNKFAVTATVGNTEVLDKSRRYVVIYIPARSYSSFDYAISTGYLVLPREYTSYKQVNLNLYLELIGQQSLDRDYHFTDLAPAVQFIFNSNTKLNIGYRTQLGGNSPRMSPNSWLFSFERTFLGAFRKK